jgi:hypothetical protein
MRRRLAIATLFALMGTLVLAARTAANEASLVAAPSSSWQTNASAMTVAYANGTVYVGGRFTSVRPPGAAAGTNETPRTYLAAFDASSGQLITSFNHTFDNLVWEIAASPDGSRIYVGGDFTTVDGVSRQRLVAFDTSTGAVVNGWGARSDWRVNALATYGNTVYIGGSMHFINGTARTGLGAVTGDTGALLPWAPTADGDVDALAVAKDGSKVFVGGKFNNISGTAHHAIASLDPTSGALIPFPAETAVPPVTPSCTSNVRDFSVDSTTVYVAAAGNGGGCFDGTFAATVSDGSLRWRNDCLGATESVEVVNGWLYKGSHAHDCSRSGDFPETVGLGGGRNLLVEYTSNGRIGPWYPDTDDGPPTAVGPLAMATDGNQLFVVGDFLNVNNQPQQGFTRFTSGPDTTPLAKPSWTNFKVASVAPGTVKINVRASTDIDNENLTYRLYRDNGSAPIATWTMRSTFWLLPSKTYEDTGLAPGSTHVYSVEVSDGTNSARTGNSAPVTVASTNAPYTQQVKADFPFFYWRLDEISGATAADSSGNNRTGTYQAAVIRGLPGATSDGNTAASFNGTNTSRVTGNNLITNPQSFSMEAWFKTTTATGGKLIGFGNSQTGTSTRYDRHIYMTNAGRLVFGVNLNGTRVITSANSYNNGNWHHVVATLSPDGMAMYVDGVNVGTNTTTTNAQSYNGYWRVGGDNLSGWPSQPTSSNFIGTIDEAAVYSFILPASSVSQHFAAR